MCARTQVPGAIRGCTRVYARTHPPTHTHTYTHTHTHTHTHNHYNLFSKIAQFRKSTGIDTPIHNYVHNYKYLNNWFTFHYSARVWKRRNIPVYQYQIIRFVHCSLFIVHWFIGSLVHLFIVHLFIVHCSFFFFPLFLLCLFCLRNWWKFKPCT
jgi:hypothetical protein